MKRLLSSVCALMIALSSSSVCFSAEDSTINIKKYIQSSTPDEVLLNKFSALSDKDGKTVAEFSDPALIHRFYDIKNDDTFTKEDVFADYSGDFSAELDDSNNYWIVPVLENETIIGEYDIHAEDTERIKGDYSVVNDGIGVGMIYSDKAFEEIFPAVKYGEPIEIKSVHIKYPAGAVFSYVKTQTNEYIIPYTNVKIGSYDDNGNYSHNIEFLRLNVYTADEWVERFKSAIKDRIRHDIEINERNVQSGDQYVSKDGDFATTMPMPTVTPNVKSTPIPTEKATAAPEENEKPTMTPQVTIEPEKQEMINIKSGDEITVELNNKVIVFPDAQPFIDENGRTKLPIRAVAEGLGCEVDWDDATRTAKIKRGDKVVYITIGKDTLLVGNETVQMDTVAEIKDERTYLPVRFVGEALGMEVNWIE